MLLALVSFCLSAAAAGCFHLPARRNTDRLNQILKSGVEALAAGDYDEAVRQFDGGLSLSPGNPTFLTNKSVALRSRGTARYNASLKLADEAARASEKEALRRDLVEALALATEAVSRVKSTNAWDALWHADAYETNRLAAFSARADTLGLLASRFDKSRAGEALAAMHEYTELETDEGRRRKAHLNTGQMLLDVGRGAEAAAEYRKVLADDPDSLDAILGAGLGLFQTGDRARYAEAAAYLRRFVERAPGNHPLRASAREALNFMSLHGIPSADARR